MTNSIQVQDADLQKAAANGMDDFLNVFTSQYLSMLGEEWNAENMARLNGDQHSLLAYHIFRRELLVGGFCQLIQNGYGAYIFDNPFAKAMRLFGAKDFSKLVYKAKKIFDENREDLEKERSEEEFMAMYENYEAFDEIEEDFILDEEEITATIAQYVDEHLDQFAQVV